MSLPTEGTQQQDVVELVLPQLGASISKWIAYSFDSHFLTPCDAWHFTTSGKYLPDAVKRELRGGAPIELRVNGFTQAAGYIDKVDRRSDRTGGAEWRIEGRDRFAYVVSSGADPYFLRFKETQTFEDVLKQVFFLFGFTQFDVDSQADRSVKTGLKHQRFSKKKGKPLKAFTLARQLKPHPGEGTFEYVSRLTHRAGFWIWPSADGQTVIVGEPDFDQAPGYALIRKTDDPTRNNVLEGEVSEDVSNQPSAILATGYGGGGEWEKNKLKVFGVNELTGLDTDGALLPFVDDLYQQHLDATLLPVRSIFAPRLYRPLANPVPLFLHDDESKTIEELTCFVKRELALRQRQMWMGSYKVAGHTQNGNPWAINTIASVDDDDTEFNAPMWVEGVRFEKARVSGAETHLSLILPFTLDFSIPTPDELAVSKSNVRRSPFVNALELPNVKAPI